MNEELIRKELKEHGIDDNPFDLALYYALELAREFLFAGRRYRNPDVLKDVQISDYSVERWERNLHEQWEILKSLSDDTIEFLRRYARMSASYEIFDIANNAILDIEKSMNTKYTKVEPCRDTYYERIRLGADSEEYKRMITLQKLVRDNMYWINKKALYDMIEIIDRGYVGCLTDNEYGMTFDRYRGFIYDNYLTRKDIHYMIDVLEKELINGNLASSFSGTNIQQMVNDCVKEAFEMNCLDYSKYILDPRSYLFDVEWILIKDPSKEWHFIPIITTASKYNDNIEKLINSVRYQLGLKLGHFYCWESSRMFSTIPHKRKSMNVDICTKFAARIKSTGEYVTLSIFDNFGNIGPANIKKHQYRYEKMVCRYNNCTEDELKENSDKYKLPESITGDWKAFKSLWEDTFNQSICPYEIITSEGLEVL